MRIVMWSGPRNLSTAMMYAFGARADCAVSDEPFYAAYLARSGIDHPMRAAVMASQPTDPVRVGQYVTGPMPGAKAHWYQKHMVQHMLPGFMPDWPDDTRHVFLIRHPARVVASYAVKRESPVLADLGFADQMTLFDRLAESGQVPVVIDSADIRADPSAALGGLCEDLSLPFDPAMLHWPTGGHKDDGVWAPHWYGAVHQSSGFAGAEPGLPELSGGFADLAEAGLAPFLRLKSFCRKIDPN